MWLKVPDQELGPESGVHPMLMVAASHELIDRVFLLLNNSSDKESL
jgi:hypothetical protein